MTDHTKNQTNPNRTATATEAVIQLVGVHLRLPSLAGPVDVLRGVTLEVAKGRSTAIVGPSGSGKTSLLMIIAGLEPATSGQVKVVGHDFNRLSEDELTAIRGRDVGIVFQSFHLIPTMTALENVAMPLELTGRNNAFSRAQSLLADVGLENRFHHYPAQLSGGEQQRVALARALAPRPRLLLADEPTGNLDSSTGSAVVDLLLELQNRTEAALVLVTHDKGLAERCDEIVRMEDGLIISHTSRGGAK